MAVRPVTVTIANGAAISDAVQLKPHEKIVGVITPAAWTAADIGFSASVDGTNFFAIVDPARETATSHARVVNVTTNAAKYYAVSEVLDLELANIFKINSIDTADNTAENQGAERSVIVVLSTRGNG